MAETHPPIVRRGRLAAHPLAAVLLCALLVRLIAVVWSQGYIHSDDHFDTVAVAYSWQQSGLWGEDGNLRWLNQPSEAIGRFPLYALSLLGMLKLAALLGLGTLQQSMYLVRLLHALISLIPVWVAFSVTRRVTGSDRWAILAGLAMALQFAMPFLGVRNLIEMVGGNLWMLVIYCYYRYRGSEANNWLLWAGIATGLAWMVRFQLAFAALPIPFVLWYERRSLRPALWYSGGVAVMMLLSGLIDLLLLGRFAGSTITNLSMNVGLPALYHTVPLMYVAILLTFLLPPLSFLLFYFMFKPSFLKRHLLLMSSSAAFILLHIIQPNQQERFIFPIVPALILAAVLALWQQKQRYGYFIKPRWLWRGIVSFSLLLDFAMLALLTPSSAKIGALEPLARLQTVDPSAHVLFVRPELDHWLPRAYGGTEMTRNSVMKWSDLPRLAIDTPVLSHLDYVVLYPPDPEKLAAYVDSVRIYCGELAPYFEVTPSAYDRLLRWSNPAHNPDYHAWVMKVMKW